MKKLFVAVVIVISGSAYAAPEFNSGVNKLNCSARKGRHFYQLSYAQGGGLNIEVFKFSSKKFFGLNNWWFDHFVRSSNMEAYQEPQARPKDSIDFGPNEITITGTSLEAANSLHTMFFDRVGNTITLDGKSLPLEHCSN